MARCSEPAPLTRRPASTSLKTASRESVSTSSRRISPSEGKRYAPFSSPRERHPPPRAADIHCRCAVDREGEPKPFRQRALPGVIDFHVPAQACAEPLEKQRRLHPRAAVQADGLHSGQERPHLS